MRVQVYYNLHKKRLSVRNRGKVIKHADMIVLHDVKFHVQPAGQAKVRKNKRKNVHAYIQGMKMRESVIDDAHTGIKSCEWQKITYNPYKHKSFVLVKDESVAVREAWFVEIRRDGVWAYLPEPSTTGTMYRKTS